MKIISQNQSEYMIVYSKDASETERNIASVLQKYLYLGANVCIPIHSDKCNKRGKEISIGLSRDLKKTKVLNDKSNEAYVIKRVKDDILLLGNSSRGTMYAVYRFLEEYIGFRAFSSDTIKYDKKKSINVSKDIVYDFPFEYREIYFTDAFKQPFASANMLNSNLADLSNAWGGKNKWYNFHHSFSDLVSPNDYFDTHPEYFSMIDGKRRKEHTELCLSNPDVLKIAVNKVLEWKKNNPECNIFSVAQDEWMGHFIKMACECDECKKIDDYEESQSGSIINFVNKVTKEVNKIYPDVLIHTFAYQYSRKPPKHIIPDNNVIVRLCNIECSWSKPIEKDEKEGKKFYEDLVNWGRITNRLYIWDYAVNFKNYLLPFPNLRSMVANIKMYKEKGVKGLLMQGNFSHGGKGYCDELKSYICARFMRYDNLDLDNEIKEFCKYYYGKNSDVAYSYIMLWEDRVYNYDLWLYDYSNHELFNDQNMNDAKTILDKAKKDKSEQGRHFELLKMSYEYAYLTRLPLDDSRRNDLFIEFKKKVINNHITELFERTDLYYSFDVIKNSRYALDRPNWYSLYYIMK